MTSPSYQSHKRGTPPPPQGPIGRAWVGVRDPSLSFGPRNKKKHFQSLTTHYRGEARANMCKIFLPPRPARGDLIRQIEANQRLFLLLLMARCLYAWVGKVLHSAHTGREGEDT